MKGNQLLVWLLLVLTIMQVACVNNASSAKDGILVKEIRENGLYGQCFSKENVKLQPSIIVLGGGDWGDYWSRTFAEKGYVGLSLPFYRRAGLPPLLEEIPLECVEKAIDWLKNDSSILPNKIFLMGASRNSELALMAASTFPEKVDGVIAYAPGTVY